MDRLFLGSDNVATNKIVEAVNKILGREVPATNGILRPGFFGIDSTGHQARQFKNPTASRIPHFDGDANRARVVYLVESARRQGIAQDVFRPAFARLPTGRIKIRIKIKTEGAIEGIHVDA